MRLKLESFCVRACPFPPPAASLGLPLCVCALGGWAELLLQTGCRSPTLSARSSAEKRCSFPLQHQQQHPPLLLLLLHPPSSAQLLLFCLPFVLPSPAVKHLQNP
ncbi:unnamed protein product [Knipowitschia caucasica]